MAPAVGADLLFPGVPEARPAGSKALFCRLAMAGRRCDMGLGDYSAVSLAQVHDGAHAARRQARARLNQSPSASGRSRHAGPLTPPT